MQLRDQNRQLQEQLREANARAERLEGYLATSVRSLETRDLVIEELRGQQHGFLQLSVAEWEHIMQQQQITLQAINEQTAVVAALHKEKSNLQHQSLEPVLGNGTIPPV